MDREPEDSRLEVTSIHRAAKKGSLERRHERGLRRTNRFQMITDRSPPAANSKQMLGRRRFQSRIAEKLAYGATRRRLPVTSSGRRVRGVLSILEASTA